MVGNPTRIALACALVAGPVICGAGAAQAHPKPQPHPSHATLVVHPGKGTPIQNAVNRAHAGDTIRVRPGHYTENVVVTKALKILGSGSGTHGSVLTPPKKAGKDACEGEAGFCVVGRTDKAGKKVLSRVSHVTVSGFRIKGFKGSAVFGQATDDLRIAHIRALNNGEYGVASFLGTRTAMVYNTATGSGEAGVYLGDSPHARGWVAHNVARDNTIGVFLRDSTDVTAEANTATGNCAGIIALHTGEGATAGGHYTLRGNTANRNSKACKADTEEGRPAISGLGIALAGVHGVLVTHNTADGNRRTGPSLASGGIAVFSTKALGGANPRDNRVERNEALDNRPNDLFWDRSGKNNLFRNNKHRTSSPAGLG